MFQDSTFSALLEKYSEYLTDASNKDDLLALGRRIFSAESTESQQRPSINLLKEKEAELQKQQIPKNEQKVRSSPSRQGHFIPPPVQNLSQDQINEEIKNLKAKNEQLRERKKELQTQYQEMQKEYNQLIIDSVSTKDRLQKELADLRDELARTLVPTRPNILRSNTPSILPVMEELSKLNKQILDKIESFRQATRDALSHCERTALDRYKPYMEKLLHDIYENAEQLPIDQLLKRFNDSADKVESEIAQLQAELTSEHSRNENLQMESRQLEERLTAQQEEVSRMKKQQSQLVRDIAKLNQISARTMNSLKESYELLWNTDDVGEGQASSARAVVITPKVKPKAAPVPLKKIASRKNAAQTNEMKRPDVKSVEAFIENEKNDLLHQIQQDQY
ncbi:hypothetical protein TVAG_102680 [Trichomonas vaginalis G3]|uniref:Uncharacterized protein n=1 Tax=Trichomonas vaginalis (strain ATCC PRA-98 / G3) TaxID=412133 RepID=A2ECX4_TRIV3|nr:AAA domain-containing protein [Trichomonas vaginalis G3]EAY09519.1 hypothetical protein TVAG_102680 [Trichomonas vaginalis G3]KAI5512980.1 AAA domain-containing protein [Trichomonas vaginalis G3]|eukprot:XP_001321742.1 hypothetical protein [Trichomonas vaginalis G3]